MARCAGDRHLSRAGLALAAEPTETGPEGTREGHPSKRRAQATALAEVPRGSGPPGAIFFWLLFFGRPKKSNPGAGRSAWRISGSAAPGARRSATGPG